MNVLKKISIKDDEKRIRNVQNLASTHNISEFLRNYLWKNNPHIKANMASLKTSKNSEHTLSRIQQKKHNCPYFSISLQFHPFTIEKIPGRKEVPLCLSTPNLASEKAITATPHQPHSTSPQPLPLHHRINPPNWYQFFQYAHYKFLMTQKPPAKVRVTPPPLSNAHPFHQKNAGNVEMQHMRLQKTYCTEE